MPYSGPSDSNLPEYVKKLSKSKRTQWVAVWTNSMSKGKSESEAFRLANGVVMGKRAAEMDPKDKELEDDAEENEAAEPDMEMSEEDMAVCAEAMGDDDNDTDPDGDEDDSDLPAFLQKKKKASQPTSEAVHQKAPMGKKGKSAAFLQHLASQMKDKFSEEEYAEMVKKARAHAGGKGKAAKMSGQMASEIADICSRAEGAEYCLFNEVNFAEPPTWIPFLPKPGNYTHPEYGEINITKARNEKFVQNFKDKVYQEKLPVDIEHKLSLSGAVAWIKDMRMAKDGQAEALVEWNERGKSLIKDDRFKYFSPAWYDKWEDPATNKTHTDVAIGGAITTRPFFKDSNLRPLVANEKGLFFQEEKAAPAKGEPEIYYFTAFAPVESPNTTVIINKGGVMPEDKKKVAGEAAVVDPAEFSELAKSFAEKEKLFADQIKALTEQSEAKDKELKTMSEKMAAQEKAARTKRFTDEVKGVDSGIRWVGKDTDHVEFLESLADSFGEDSKQIKMYVEQQRSHSQQLEKAGLFKEIGSSNSGGISTASSQVEAKVTEIRTANPKLSREQAFAEALNADPSLYEAYERELMA